MTDIVQIADSVNRQSL